MPSVNSNNTNQDADYELEEVVTEVSSLILLISCITSVLQAILTISPSIVSC